MFYGTPAEACRYDIEGRRAFGNRATIWLARWVLQQPDDVPFYAQQVKTDLAPLLSQLSIGKPYINSSARTFEGLGMLQDGTDQVTPARRVPHAAYYVAVSHPGWEPYAVFLERHMSRHAEAFAAITEAVVLEALPSAYDAQLRHS